MKTLNQQIQYTCLGPVFFRPDSTEKAAYEFYA